MKYTIFLLCILYLIGCSATKKTMDESAPILLLQYPLPPIPESIISPSIKLEMMLYILADGTVDKVQLIKGSNENNWDSLAVASVRKWLFRPAKMNNQPISTWYRLKTIVRFANPQNMLLAQILCSTAEEADSAYIALQRGEDFGELAKQYSVAHLNESKGMLGEVDINMYPSYVRDILKTLDANEFTKPIKYGDFFAIFKRLK